MLIIRVFVHGIGKVGLPLTYRDAAGISRIAHQAPFGKGSETYVDSTVRKTWEFNPSQFDLQNPAWTATVQDGLRRITDDMGIVGGASMIHPEIRKSLLYEPGAFFENHRDTEKALGVLATLVTVLPSQHTGGDVLVQHGDQARTLRTEGQCDYGFSYLAKICEMVVKAKKSLERPSKAPMTKAMYGWGDDKPTMELKSLSRISDGGLGSIVEGALTHNNPGMAKAAAESVKQSLPSSGFGKIGKYLMQRCTIDAWLSWQVFNPARTVLALILQGSSSRAKTTSASASATTNTTTESSVSLLKTLLITSEQPSSLFLQCETLALEKEADKISDVIVNMAAGTSTETLQSLLLPVLRDIPPHSASPPKHASQRYANIYRAVLSSHIHSYGQLSDNLPDSWQSLPRVCQSPCGYCPKLNSFLTDPKTTTTQYKSAEPFRKHLEQQLYRSSCKFWTKKQNKPFTLVVERTPKEREVCLEARKQRCDDARKAIEGIRFDRIGRVLGIGRDESGIWDAQACSWRY
ncbi:MAG: hypothetical protein Q9170_002894 [Blastenia crenularia]